MERNENMKKIIMIFMIFLLFSACSNLGTHEQVENNNENVLSEPSGDNTNDADTLSDTEDYYLKDEDFSSFFAEEETDIPDGWEQHTVILKTIKYSFVTDNNTYAETDGFGADAKVTFAVPEDYTFVDNYDENTLGVFLSNNEIIIHISSVSLFDNDNDNKKYLEYKANQRLDPLMCNRIMLRNGIVDSIIYPRINYEGSDKNFTEDMPSTHKHYAEIICDGKIIRFNVTEYRSPGKAVVSDEVFSIIEKLSRTFSMVIQS